MKRSIALAAIAAAPFALQGRAFADEPIKLATLPVDASALVFYANDMGFLKEAGLSVDVRRVAGGAIPPAVVSGALDIGWSNMISLATAYKRGIPFTVIAAGGVYVRGNPTSGLFVSKSSTVRNGHDLNGKTIACDALVNLGQFSTQFWIDRNGGDSASVKFLEMPFGDMAGALAQKRVDAAFIGEPFIEQAKDDLRLLGAPLDFLAPRTMIGAWFTTTNWARQHADTVKAFASAMSTTAAWANAHQDRSALILAKSSGVDPAIVKSMRRIEYGTHVEAKQMQAVIDLAARYHSIPSAFPAREMIFA